VKLAPGGGGLVVPKILSGIYPCGGCGFVFKAGPYIQTKGVRSRFNTDMYIYIYKSFYFYGGNV
jgi:ribosomal protein L37AE/L43A